MNSHKHKDNAGDVDEITLLETLWGSPSRFVYPVPGGQRHCQVWRPRTGRISNALTLVHILLDSETTDSKATSAQVADVGPQAKLLSRQWDKLVLSNGVLFRTIQDTVSSISTYSAQCHRATAFKGLHSDCWSRMDRFYWPKMQLFVGDQCRSCQTCVRRKAKAPKTARWVTISTRRPLELLCMTCWKGREESSCQPQELWCNWCPWQNCPAPLRREIGKQLGGPSVCCGNTMWEQDNMPVCEMKPTWTRDSLSTDGPFGLTRRGRMSPTSPVEGATLREV